MRNFRTDFDPSHSFLVDFQLKDPFRMLDSGPPVHLRYHSLTDASEVTISESWVDTTNWQGRQGGTQDTWIPTLMVRRRGPESAFLGVLEPYREKKVILKTLRQKSSQPDVTILQVLLQNGATDWFLFRDPGDLVKALETETPKTEIEFQEIPLDKDGRSRLVLTTNAVVTWVRLRDGTVESMTSYGGSAEVKTA